MNNELGKEIEYYQIKVRGHLDPKWRGWLDNLCIEHKQDGNTNLIGPLADQAALHGLLNKIRDLGLPLISVNPMDPTGWENPSP